MRSTGDGDGGGGGGGGGDGIDRWEHSNDLSEIHVG